MSADPLKALHERLGDETFRAESPGDLDGIAPRATLEPHGGEALAESLRALSEQGLCALVRGSGSRLAFGNPPRAGDVWLSTAGLAGVEELDADEGVARVRAGTSLAELTREARRSGWEPALEAPEPDATLGGVLACGAVGPRVHAFGRPRDQVLGLEVVLADGARTRSGGRVVKNVTGYDLAKLHVGALGTLGVIEAAWLRLRPLPELALTLQAALADPERAFALGAQAAARAGARAVAVLPAAVAGHGLSLVVELAGDAPVVERDRAWLERSADGVASEVDGLSRVRARQAAAPPGRVRARLACAPARVPDAVRPLRAEDAELIAYPGAGLVYALFPPGTGADGGAAHVREALRAAARAARGSWRIEAAPLEVKRAGDVFGETPDALPLMRALKHEYDPGGTLNPGRFVGGL